MWYYITKLAILAAGVTVMALTSQPASSQSVADQRAAQSSSQLN